MSLFKCKNCGEALDLSLAQNGVCKCALCNMYQTVSTKVDFSNEIESLYGDAGHFRKNHEFDIAIAEYQRILSLNREDAEAHFCVALCRYGVEYVRDPRTGKTLPTVNRTQLKAFSDDDDFALALEYATSEQREEFLKQAELIDDILRGYWQISNNEPPFDVFVCYKETAEDGQTKTEDFEVAQHLYRELKREGLNVFFASETLKGKLGSEYEPYIFSALNSARFMLVVGTKKEHLNAVWVKNEWARYLALISQGKKKTLIPVYKGMNPYDLPKEFKNLQGQNYGEIGAVDRIILLITEILNKEKPKSETVVVTEAKVIDNTAPSNHGTRQIAPRASGTKKKTLAITIAAICAVLLIGSIIGGIGYSNSIKNVNSVIQLVDSIPKLSNVTDFASYEEAVNNAYAQYEALANWQKNKVSNKSKLLEAIAEYDEYVVEGLRKIMNEVSVETVAATDSLEKATQKYTALTSAQKSKLSSSEAAILDNYVRVYQIISIIYEINGDLVNKRDKIPEMKSLYNLIDEQYRSLVYNYNLVDTFEAQLDFLSRLVFSSVDGGYSVKVAEGAELSGEVVIPSIYNDMDVVKIESNAFLNQRNITSITVPKTVTQIDVGAFAGCNRLESLTLPFVGSSLTSGVFTHIFGSSTVPQSLKKVTVTLQDKVVDSAFAGCSYIEQVFYEEEIEYIGSSCFDGCEALLSFNSSEPGTLNLFGSMDKIGDSAFKNCKLITNIVFSDEILVIGNYAFSGCRNVEELRLTSRMIEIGDFAFQDLKKITQITVYNSTELIGEGAFNGCNAVEKISVPFVGRAKASRYVSFSHYYGSGGGMADYELVLGFIFGYEKLYTSGWNGKETHNANPEFINSKYGEKTGYTWQYTFLMNNPAIGSDHYAYLHYAIPQSLNTVIVTNQSNVPTAAFNGCSMLTNVIFTQGIDSQGECAFQSCNATISHSMPSISFNSNGGTSIETIFGIPGTEIELPVPTKENYIFAQWLSDNGNAFTSSVMPNDNITLTAKWLPMIIFDTASTQDVESIVQESGTPIELPILTRDGYSFAGWYLGDEKFTVTSMPAQSVTLKAGWYKIIEKSETVYNGGGSSYKFSGLSTPSISSPLCFEIDFRSLIPNTADSDSVTVTFTVDMSAGTNINEIRASCYNNKTFSEDTTVFSKSFTEFTSSYYTYSIQEEMSANGIVYLCFYTPNGQNNNNSDNVMRIRKLTYTICYNDSTVLFE